MIEFKAADYLAIIEVLGQVRALLTSPVREMREKERNVDIRQRTEEITAMLAKHSGNFELSPAMQSLFGSLEKQANKAHFDVVTSLIDEVQAAIQSEFAARMFFCLSPKESQLWNQAEDIFGDGPKSEFPDSVRDMGAAVRCTAL